MGINGGLSNQLSGIYGGIYADPRRSAQNYAEEIYRARVAMLEEHLGIANKPDVETEVLLLLED